MADIIKFKQTMSSLYNLCKELDSGKTGMISSTFFLKFLNLIKPRDFQPSKRMQDELNRIKQVRYINYKDTINLL